MTNRRTMLKGATVALALSLSSTAAFAQEEVLTLEHFLPPQANVPVKILDVWADRIEAESEGRIKVERYPAMQLGGTPPELIDHVQDGIADVVWTVVGYTPGRFPRTEVFELPFFVEDARAASYAYAKINDKYLADAEFQDVHVVGTWVHGPGMFHTKDPVTVPADLEGMKIRGGSRLVNDLLGRVGAEPIGMPVPAVSEALSKGVVDGTTIPWEVTGALKVPELVGNHTEFEGPALYNLTFVMALNKDRYDAMSDENRAVIDANSGVAFSIFAGGVMEDSDGPARQVAVDRGNNIITVPQAEAESAWNPIVEPMYAAWVADMDAKGYDGQALIDEARALMAEYTADMDSWGK